MQSGFVYDEPADFRDAGVNFGDEDPLGDFAALIVYVEYGQLARERQMTQVTIPGQRGLWVAAYSSLRRLQLARGDDDLDYSATNGEWVLASKPPSVGIWFDPCFPGGRPVLLPNLDVEWDQR